MAYQSSDHNFCCCCSCLEHEDYPIVLTDAYEFLGSSYIHVRTWLYPYWQPYENMSYRSMLVAITSDFLSALYRKTNGYHSLILGLLITYLILLLLRPIITPDHVLFPRFLYPHQETVMDDSWISCVYSPSPLSTTERTTFHNGGCMVYGYPSSGGVLVKEASLLDMQFLSLSRFHESQRAPTADEEDRFCRLLRRTGATLWPSERNRIAVQIGMCERELTEEEEKIVVFGWPMDGVGVWVLRYRSVEQQPRGIAKLSLALSMEEKIEMMREFGATFFEDVTQVEELRDG